MRTLLGILLGTLVFLSLCIAAVAYIGRSQLVTVELAADPSRLDGRWRLLSVDGQEELRRQERERWQALGVSGAHATTDADLQAEFRVGGTAAEALLSSSDTSGVHDLSLSFGDRPMISIRHVLGEGTVRLALFNRRGPLCTAGVMSDELELRFSDPERCLRYFRRDPFAD